MALGGGTFLVQNKVLPGAYINFVSRPKPTPWALWAKEAWFAWAWNWTGVLRK